MQGGEDGGGDGIGLLGGGRLVASRGLRRVASLTIAAVPAVLPCTRRADPVTATRVVALSLKLGLAGSSHRLSAVAHISIRSNGSIPTLQRVCYLRRVCGTGGGLPGDVFRHATAEEYQVHDEVDLRS